MEDNESLLFIFPQLTTERSKLLQDKYLHLTVQQGTEQQPPRLLQLLPE